jgi:YD repeat-containing protein
VGQHFLFTVKSPENTIWKYEYYDSASADQKGNRALRKITYPHGATISYTYDWVQFDATSGYKTTSIKTKTVGREGTSGTVGRRSVTSGTWSYSFTPGNWSTGTNDQTNITAPDNVTLKYQHYGYAAATRYYGTLWKVGSIIQKEIRSSSTLLQKDAYTWDPLLVSTDSMQRPSRPLADPDTFQPFLKSRVITRDSANYTLSNTAHDAYGNVTAVTENGNAGDVRRSTFTYYINTAKWIIHKLKNESIIGEGSITRSYDTSGRLTTENKYGIITNYGYYSTGDLRTITDGRGYITRFGDYHRGVARCELRPVKVFNPLSDFLHGQCASSNAPDDVIEITRTVDGFGNITSEVDGRGISTGYGFDKLDRLVSINHPIHADESITWQTDKKTITRGLYSKTSLLDGFGREIETSTSQWKRIVAYDIYGRTQQECLPVTPTDTATLCTTYQFDAIGRLKTITNPDATQASYVYSNSQANTVTITDERNNTRTYTYISYSDPDETWLHKIVAPIDTSETLYTTIDRDKLGNVVQVRQGTQNNSADRTRVYHYYPTKLLEWIQYPEIGNRKIYFSYDGVGNKVEQWAEGKPKTVFDYDGQNRLVKIDHPETTASTNFDVARLFRTKNHATSRRSCSYPIGVW